MERTTERRRFREIGVNKLGAALLTASLAIAGCSGNNGGESSQPSASPVQTTASESTPTTEAQAPFRITQIWSLPPREQFSPPIMTAELCEQGFWQDEGGKRQPPVQQNPRIVRVDGRCNTPLNVEENGVYGSPQQEGRALIRVLNGAALGVECYSTGQFIQDIRGPRSGSDVWLGVVTANGEQGFFPETNAGYVDERNLSVC